MRKTSAPAGRVIVAALTLALCFGATSRVAIAPASAPVPIAAVAPPARAVDIRPTAVNQAQPVPVATLEATRDAGQGEQAAGNTLGNLTAALLPSQAGDLRLLVDSPRYALTLDISPDRRVVTGTQVTRYTNRETKPLAEILIRLYPNTAYMASAMRLTRLEVDGLPAPTVPITLRSADNQAPVIDTSVISIPLASPLAPRAALTLSLAFTIQVAENPTTGYRAFGRVNGTLALPSAYAEIPARRGGAWLISAAPALGDIVLAEAAWFTADVETGADLTVVAPGICARGAASRSDRQRVACVAGPIREFALTLGRFDRVAGVARLAGGDVTVESYATPGRMRGATLALRMATDALLTYEKRFGPYPFRILKVYESPTTIGGMEYSMLAGVTDSLYDAPEAPYFEWIVAHEVAHQWWYGLVGSDPINEPWLDEALANYSLTLYFEDTRGAAYALANRNSDYYGRYAAILQNHPDQPAGLPSGMYNPATYGAFVYGKGPIFFDSIRRASGDEAFFRWMRLYAARHRFGIAQSADLLDAADAAGIGAPARTAFRAWVAPP